MTGEGTIIMNNNGHNNKSFEDLETAAEHLNKAAENMADRVFGKEVQSSLREAARHVLHAARHSIDRAEECLDKCAERRQSGGSAKSPESAEQDAHPPATSQS